MAHVHWVLLVDAEGPRRAALAAAIAGAGFAVTTAATSKQAARILRARSRAQASLPDVILVDLDRVRRFEAMRALRSIASVDPIPLLALAPARFFRSDHHPRSAAGFDICWLKPIATDDVLDALATYLPRSSSKQLTDWAKEASSIAALQHAPRREHWIRREHFDTRPPLRPISRGKRAAR